jgi:hypothetical protein
MKNLFLSESLLTQEDNSQKSLNAENRSQKSLDVEREKKCSSFVVNFFEIDLFQEARVVCISLLCEYNPLTFLIF